VPAKLAAVVERLLRQEAAERFQTGTIRAGRGNSGPDLRPPLLRAFMRNAQVSTMVLLATLLAERDGDNRGDPAFNRRVARRP
jgi:hypothetical protein